MSHYARVLVERGLGMARSKQAKTRGEGVPK